jgi:hypothetical protein
MREAKTGDGQKGDADIFTTRKIVRVPFSFRRPDAPGRESAHERHKDGRNGKATAAVDR